MKWVLLSLVFLLQYIDYVFNEELDLKIVTVATDETDGYLRFMRSIRVNDLDVEVFGLHQQWLGGDIARGPGGGQKVNILREELNKYRNDKNLVLMFTDSYDVVFAAGKSEILKKFKTSGAQVLFSAENFCWPDASLSNKYPVFLKEGYKFLCSGGFIGYAPNIYDLLKVREVNDTEDDQLYYTQIYLNDGEKYGIQLDRTADLFQNLNGNQDHVEPQFDGPNVKVLNTRFNTNPIVIHGNGPSKNYLNHLANYVPKGWTHTDGCLSCNEDKIILEDIKVTEWPKILIALFILVPTPFIDSFLHQISNLDYPKNRIDVFIYSAENHHDNDIDTWIKEFTGAYQSIDYQGPKSFLTENIARNIGISRCSKVNCDYYFSVDSSVSLSNRKTLQILIEQNKTFIGPILSKVDKYWSNFWGMIGRDGFYKRSPDYLDIIRNFRKGVWNIPHISHAYLIKSSLQDLIGVHPFHTYDDIYITFCMNNRKKGIFMYATNIEDFGHLKELSSYEVKFKRNDLYQIFENKLDWEEKYLHPKFTEYLKPKSKTIEACQDVFWFPAFTTNFTRDLIEECEYSNKWSRGGHKDERITGGYENVPTVDIHMKQIELEKHWLHILKVYIGPMANRLYAGYFSRSDADMNFIVKYSPSGQNYLRPHHDASTYSINVALNERGVDYSGGGVHFLRYNCSILDTKVGWALIHPGKLTHQHEGLPTTNGTRYILVSFIDP